MKANMCNIIIGHLTSSTAKVWFKSLYDNSACIVKLLSSNEVLEEHSLEYEGPASHCVFTFGASQKLQAQTSYTIELHDGDKVTYGSFTTFPVEGQEERLRCMFSSCFLNRNLLVRKKQLVYPNLAMVSKETESNFMMFLGDQIYVDTFNYSTPKKPTYKTYEDHYLKNWSLPGAKTFFANHSSYMILDDHEIANDFDNAREELKINKEVGLAVYDDYQDSHNPMGNHGPYFYQFQYGDIYFFVLDTRTERDSSKGMIISEDQEKNLLQWLDDHEDKMKVLISSVPITIQSKENTDKWSDPRFKAQHKRVLRRITEKGDDRLVMLCGDFHSAIHGSISTNPVKGDATNAKKTWNEFMAGPLNQALVNKKFMFAEEATIVDQTEWEMNYSLQYQRKEMHTKYTNVGVLDIDFNEKSYLIEVSWYRAQHPYLASKIASTKIQIPRK